MSDRSEWILLSASVTDTPETYDERLNLMIVKSSHLQKVINKIDN